MATGMLRVTLLALLLSGAWLGLPDAVLGGPCTPTTEVCDGVDNDCDEEVDEAMGVGQSCTKGCGPGTLVCDGNGGVTCDAPAPLAEICDGADNDCDGSVDEDPSGVGGARQNTTPGVGSCPGVVVCHGAEGLF